MSKKIKSLTFYPNGHVSARDEQGEQMGEIQATGWLELYFDHLLEMGYDVRDIPDIHARLNDGELHRVRPILSEAGQWAYKIEPI